MNILDYVYKTADIMKREFLQASGTDSLEKVINLLLENSQDEVVILSNQGQLQGVLVREILTELYKKKDLPLKQPALDFAVRDILTISPQLPVKQAQELFLRNNLQWAPVVAQEQVVGLLTWNQVQNALYAKLEELFSLQTDIIDNIHEAVCICNPLGKVIYWNKSSEVLYGVSKKDIIGNYVQNFFPQALTLTVLAQQKPIINKRHEPVEGKSVILSTLPVFNQKKELIAVVSTDRDITEQVVLSQKLAYAEKSVEILQNNFSKEIAAKYSFPKLIGKSKELIAAISLAQKVAPTSTSILITGESGTGKEVFARGIHEASGRKGQFIAVNCTAIPESLLESELFGYVEGAFTNAAKKGKIGMFELADKGTLLLDEIGDMPLSMQGKILRVLQDGVIYRLGSSKPIATNTRIIAATNKNLKEAIVQKQFREDLFYRLAVFQLELPPLRERKEDVKDLIDFFVSEVGVGENIAIDTIDERIYSVLSAYPWPGNIRELKNVIQRMVVLSSKGHLTFRHLPRYILENIQEDYLPDKYDLEYHKKELEKSLIREVMDLAGGNKQKAAEILKIKRTTLYYKLKQYNLWED